MIRPLYSNGFERMSTPHASTLRSFVLKRINTPSYRKQLSELLEGKIEDIKLLLTLPAKDPISAVICYVERYICRSTDLLDAVAFMESHDETLQYCAQTKAAASAFVDDMMADTAENMDNPVRLLYVAYFVHRMMEELNDQFAVFYGYPLLPCDLTHDNVVIHQVIGEEFGNHLDLGVHFAMESIIGAKTAESNQTHKRSQEQHEACYWKTLQEKWPSLMEENDLKVDLLSRRTFVYHTDTNKDTKDVH